MKGNKITTVIVNYSFPKKMSRSETLERFKQAAETFVGMDGLNSKQFIYDELSGKCFSVYNWEPVKKPKLFSTMILLPILKGSLLLHQHLRCTIAWLWLIIVRMM